MITLYATLAALPWLQGFFEPTAVSHRTSQESSYDGLTLGDFTAKFPAGWIPGSADEVVALAQGDAVIGTPVVVLAVTTGGRAESVTTLTMFRIDAEGALQPIFRGDVERHEGHTTRAGVITLIPGGLVASEPDGTISLWVYDAARGRYIEQVSTRPSA